jgi:hypothetical protein
MNQTRRVPTIRVCAEHLKINRDPPHMKHRIAPSVLLGLLFFPAMLSAIAQAPLDIALGAPAGFIASDIHAGGDGRYCISGSVVDDTGPSESAYVLLVDTTHRQVLWRASIWS